MSPPTIAAYLVKFDAALQARLGRRRRIVAEIEDHLREAAAAGLKRGLGRAEAAAIACFGDPPSVAEGFGADAVARVTTRLVVFGHRLDLWMAQRPWKGAALAASVPAVVYLIASTVGVLFDRLPAYIIPVSALEPFPLTVLIWGTTSPLPSRPPGARAVGSRQRFRTTRTFPVPISLVAGSGGSFLVSQDGGTERRVGRSLPLYGLGSRWRRPYLAGPSHGPEA